MYEYTSAYRARALFFVLTFVFLGGAAPGAGAQDAAFLEEFAGHEGVTRTQMADLLGELGLVVYPQGQRTAAFGDESLRADELAAIIAQAADLPANLGYRLFGSRRYALQMVRDADIYPANPRRFPGGAAVSGLEVLALARDPLLRALSEDPPGDLALPVAPREGRREGPWLEWNFIQTVASEAGEDSFGASSFSDLEMRFILTPRVEVHGSVRARGTVDDDGKTAGGVLIPYFFLGAYREPDSLLPGGSVEVGRLAGGSRTVDGARLSVLASRVSATASLGYTGFVDQGLTPLPEIRDDDLVSRGSLVGTGIRGPRRLVAEGSVVFPEQLRRQSPGITALSVIKPPVFDEAEGADRLDLHQLGVSFSGPVGVRTFYDAHGSIQFGAYTAGDLGLANREYLGWVAAGELRHFPALDGRQRLRLALRLASGGAPDEGSMGLDGGAGRHTGYIPLAGDVPWSVYQGTGTNAGSLELEYVQRVSEALRVSVSALGLTRLTSGDTGAPGIDDAETDSLLVGAEFSAGIGVQPLPGVIFELNGNIFQPWTREWGGSFMDSARRDGKLAFTAVVEL